MVLNRTLTFCKEPEGIPVAGRDIKVLHNDFDASSSPPTGGFVAKVLFASFDPSLRRRMIVSTRTEFPPFEIASPIVSYIIVTVTATSTGTDFQKYAHWIGRGPIQEYIVVDESAARGFRPVQNPWSLDLQLFLGPLGMPGLAAFALFYEAAHPTKGGTIFITSASGAVGQVVGQLAKIEGMKVIGSAGSDEKVKILSESLHFDGALNYNRVDVLEELRRLAPEGLDVFFDNAGGMQLEAGIECMNELGRIVSCGYASQYSVPADQRYGIRNTGLVVGKRLVWRGLSINHDDLGSRYAEKHQQIVSKLIHDGSFTPLLSVTKGIDDAAEALVSLFKGENIGKALLQISGE
ncbi:hypothetical protein BFJ69_g15817 [Fusarium oxysporum]|uniref:Enoyl reductase (ER) domain-containing protein n=1 Tax=Fusarium oxysporum TaxID=5507 RepID=A0A420MER0_FUSOX|nr:hypothetical protein BFJ69_g15817 [Fusarium oxysporum]